MWPTLVRIGTFEISSFGVMMFLAFTTASLVLNRQFRRYGLPADAASSMVLWAALGGIAGAKVYYAILHRDAAALFTRAGLVWYGGLIGGFIICSLFILRRKLPYLTVADAAAPALAIGYGVGRIGCFLVGDDYGRPTALPIGIAFPHGAPPTTAAGLRSFGVAVDARLPADALLRVHPTQLYESAAGVIIFAIVITFARRSSRPGIVFALFLILLGIERFLIEFVRAKDDRFLGPFTIAQAISAVLIVAGLVLFARNRTDSAGREVPV